MAVPLNALFFIALVVLPIVLVIGASGDWAAMALVAFLTAAAPGSTTSYLRVRGH
ncbi:hypothetical protein ACH44C_29325 [Streptomyces purpureus]|uniref:hypothetical protein n=1 Tax=Streptomyces purpureus TaxID=1951 RepID=UPI0037B300C5